MTLAEKIMVAAPFYFSWGAFAAVGAIFFLARWKRARIMLIAAGMAGAFRLALAGFETYVQYHVWAGNAFTALLLPPHQSVSYFAGYSFMHFWMTHILSIAVALLFYIFLRALRRHTERFFEEGETETGLAVAVVTGWPSFLAFVPLVFLGVVAVSLVRLVAFKEAYTTLGIPFLVGGGIMVFYGPRFAELLHAFLLGFGISARYF